MQPCIKHEGRNLQLSASSLDQAKSTFCASFNDGQMISNLNDSKFEPYIDAHYFQQEHLHKS